MKKEREYINFNLQNHTRSTLLLLDSKGGIVMTNNKKAIIKTALKLATVGLRSPSYVVSFHCTFWPNLIKELTSEDPVESNDEIEIIDVEVGD